MTMQDYDSLPDPIRSWMVNETEDWDAATVLGYWRIWRGSVEQFVRMLEESR